MNITFSSLSRSGDYELEKSERKSLKNNEQNTGLLTNLGQDR
jgi:hypothetical protein